VLSPVQDDECLPPEPSHLGRLVAFEGNQPAPKSVTRLPCTFCAGAILTLDFLIDQITLV
jgi:hypothetical protein